MSGGNLYQLKTNAPLGAAVVIGGTYDTYGTVMAHRESGFHLIRGTGHTKPHNRTLYNTGA